MENKNDVLLQEKLEEGEILILTLNRPQHANAVNLELCQALLDVWTKLATTSTESIKCVILTGTGNKAFSAGADLKERKGISSAQWKDMHAVLKQMISLMFNCPIPLIAAVNGDAYGGGLEYILACDFAYASKNAVFAQAEVKRGIMPGAMGTQLLPRTCGIKRAKELALSGDSFTAAAALRYGIVNALFEPENLMENVLNTAKSIAANAPLSTRAIKKALNASLDMSIQSGYEAEVAAYYELLDTKDREEGIQAFIEKRNPIFKGY